MNRTFKIGSIAVAVLLVLPFFVLLAEAAQNDVFLAKMKVLREINLGSVYDYEVESARGGIALLKTPPFRMKVGESANFFVKEGASEGGKPAYIILTTSSPRSLSEGFAAVKVGGGWIFVNKEGQLLIRNGFDDAYNFSNSYAFIKLPRDAWGFIGKNGDFLETPPLSPIDYDPRENRPFIGFREKVAGVKAQTKDHSFVPILLGSDGKIIKRLSDYVYFMNAFSEGLAATRDSAKFNKHINVHAYGFLDTTGKVAIPHQFAWAGNFINGLAPVEIFNELGNRSGRFGYINKSGKLVTETSFQAAADFSEERAAVKSGGSWGFIDKEGKTIANPVYQEVRPFSEGLAAVKIGGKWGYINKEGQLVIKAVYYNAKDFSAGLAPVSPASQYGGGSDWGYIDNKGNFVIKPQYSRAESHSEGLALVCDRAPGTGYKWKYINTKGQAALWFYAYD